MKPFVIHSQAISLLDQQVAELQAEYASQMQCQKGCSSCCADNFKVRWIEAAKLLEAFASLPAETANTVLEQLNAPANGSCPLLVDGACSVYTSRPALCRAYRVIVKLRNEFATCHLNFNEPNLGVPLKGLDLQPYYELLDELSTELWRNHPLATMTGSAEPPVLTIRDFLNLFFQQVQTPKVVGSSQEAIAIGPEPLIVDNVHTMHPPMEESDQSLTA
jgi:Fe-S-cluster containining protein